MVKHNRTSYKINPSLYSENQRFVTRVSRSLENFENQAKFSHSLYGPPMPISNKPEKKQLQCLVHNHRLLTLHFILALQFTEKIHCNQKRIQGAWYHNKVMEIMHHLHIIYLTLYLYIKCKMFKHLRVTTQLP